MSARLFQPTSSGTSPPNPPTRGAGSSSFALVRGRSAEPATPTRRRPSRRAGIASSLADRAQAFDDAADLRLVDGAHRDAQRAGRRHEVNAAPRQLLGAGLGIGVKHGGEEAAVVARVSEPGG